MSARGQTAIVGFCEIATQRDYGDRSTASLMAEVPWERSETRGSGRVISMALSMRKGSTL